MSRSKPEGMPRPGRESVRYRSVGSGRRVLIEQIKLILTLFITGCLLIAAETTLCARVSLPLLGWSPASPALGLLFSMAVGFLHGEREGGVAGMLCGWLIDAISPQASVGGMMLLPLLYFLCGYLSGTIGKRRLAHNLPSFVVFSIFGGALRGLYTLGLATLELGGIPPVSWIWRGLVSAWALTVICSVAVYGIVWWERKIMEAK